MNLEMYNYLISAINLAPVRNTSDIRIKAELLSRFADEIDAVNSENKDKQETPD